MGSFLTRLGLGVPMGAHVRHDEAATVAPPRGGPVGDGGGQDATGMEKPTYFAVPKGGETDMCVGDEDDRSGGVADTEVTGSAYAGSVR
ncbi:hypothetical protein GCM10010521_59910 [Streptomyces rameus]|uniref:Uncharacterized protein n=1 Tax=Streptomyces rameus TaxID=68261 RepID=A0ABN3V121_9ACTN